MQLHFSIISQVILIIIITIPTTYTGASAPDVSRVAVSGPSSITVSWNIPDVNTSYVAYYQLLQGEEDNKTVSSSAGELTIDGLQPDRLYTVRVFALSQHLPSPLWGPIQIKVAGETPLPPPPPPPPPPTHTSGY